MSETRDARRWRAESAYLRGLGLTEYVPTGMAHRDGCEAAYDAGYEDAVRDVLDVIARHPLTTHVQESVRQFAAERGIEIEEEDEGDESD